MSTLKKLKQYLTDSQYHTQVNMRHGLYDRWDDEKFIRKRFRLTMGYELDLQHPKTFNEKLQWLKLNDRKPEYSDMVDKYLAKKYAAELIGEQYILPTLGVWDKFEEIDFDSLPDRFVLKCTHDSHSVVVCSNKADLDFRRAARILNNGLKDNYYYKYREWPYKNVVPRIIAEAYLEGGPSGLTDYKVLCFDGEPKALEVCTNRFSKEGLCIDFYDTDWNRLPIRTGDTPNSKNGVERPDKLEEILELSRKLSRGMIHVRCDFYIADDRIYFGEMTFYRAAGFKRLYPEEWDIKMGSWIHLPVDD